MRLLILLSAVYAAEPPPLLPRSAEGVAEGIGELRGALQDCVSEAGAPGEVLVHLRFSVDKAGAVGAVTASDPHTSPELSACMAAPFAALQFVPGEQAMPVEVPISVQTTHTERTMSRE